MGFFFNEAKQEAKVKKSPAGGGRKGPIPINSLQQLGCKACPRDQDADKIQNPKMEPSGVGRPSVYLLGTSPSTEDDRNNNHWTDKAGAFLYSTFRERFMSTQVRSNFITQCFGDQTEASVECCRGRVVRDIEESKPLVVVTIGDPPLKWALGSSSVNSIVSHGTLIPTKIGNHVCWVYPLMWPNFVHKTKGFGPSPYELVIKSEINQIIRWIDDGEFESRIPEVFDGDHFEGMEVITGHNPGDLERLRKALSDLSDRPRISFDIETNGLRPYLLKTPLIITIAISDGESTVAFPLDHPEGWATDGWRAKAWGLVIDFFQSCGSKIAHNSAMEMEWMSYFLGPSVLRGWVWEDSMAVAHTIDERPGTKSLDYQCRITFGFWLKALSNLDPGRLLEYDLGRVLKYNGLDAKWTARVWARRIQVVNADPKLRAEYDRKLRLAPTLVMTEMQGVMVSPTEVDKHFNDLTATLKNLERKITHAPEVVAFEQKFRSRFSPTAPEQVLKMLQEVCRRDEIKRIDRDGKVSYTTDEEALSAIPADEVPSAPLILEHRATAKLLSTYVLPIKEGRITTRSGMVHARYSSMVAVTGRLACEDPNLQNWPKRKYRQIRSSFRAPDDQAFVAADYGQIEFRVVGMASEDPQLVQACWTGYDVHKFWAERMVAMFPEIKDYIVTTFGVDWDEKGLKTLRQEAKNGWVFPQLFGSSVRSCAEQLHLPLDVAERLAGEFWDTFPKVKKWQEKLIKNYERDLYVETLGGRKRRGAMTKNEIINHPIQGTAADIVTEGMNAISELGEATDRNFLIPRLNVHDDLSFYIPDAELDSGIKVVAQEMCRPRFDYINVPLVVEVSIGTNWADLEEIAVYRSDVLFNLRNPYA